MSKLLVLSQEAIGKILDLNMALRGVESAYRQKARGEGVLFPMVFHEFQPGSADMDIKSGHLAQSGVYGLKLVSWFGGNPGKGLPALFGSSLLFDDTTGEPIALLNAGGITGMRTGAAGAIGAKYLAVPGAKNLLMVGAGEQAPFQIAATLIAVPTVERVFLCSPRGPVTDERKAHIQTEISALLQQAGHDRDYALDTSVTLEKAAPQCEIIITATPARSPILQSGWVRPGTHISCIGADLSGKQELESALLARARVFTDDAVQSVFVGECEMAIQDGVITQLHILGEIGQVISGELPGRLSPKDITVFDSTGIALQDLIVAQELVSLARERGIGTVVEL